MRKFRLTALVLCVLCINIPCIVPAAAAAEQDVTAPTRGTSPALGEFDISNYGPLSQAEKFSQIHQRFSEETDHLSVVAQELIEYSTSHRESLYDATSQALLFIAARLTPKSILRSREINHAEQVLDDSDYREFMGDPQAVREFCEKHCDLIAGVAKSGFWKRGATKYIADAKDLFELAGTENFQEFVDDFLYWERIATETSAEGELPEQTRGRWNMFVESSGPSSDDWKARDVKDILAAYRHWTSRRGEWEKVFELIDTAMAQ